MAGMNGEGHWKLSDEAISARGMASSYRHEWLDSPRKSARSLSQELVAIKTS